MTQTLPENKTSEKRLQWPPETDSEIKELELMGQYMTRGEIAEIYKTKKQRVDAFVYRHDIHVISGPYKTERLKELSEKDKEELIKLSKNKTISQIAKKMNKQEESIRWYCYCLDLHPKRAAGKKIYTESELFTMAMRLM